MSFKHKLLFPILTLSAITPTLAVISCSQKTETPQTPDETPSQPDDQDKPTNPENPDKPSQPEPTPPSTDKIPWTPIEPAITPKFTSVSMTKEYQTIRIIITGENLNVISDHNKIIVQNLTSDQTFDGFVLEEPITANQIILTKTNATEMTPNLEYKVYIPNVTETTGTLSLISHQLYPGDNNYDPTSKVILSSGNVELKGSSMILTIKGQNLHPSINFYGNGAEIDGTPIEYGMLYQPENFTSNQIQYVYQFNNQWAGKKITLSSPSTQIVEGSINLTIPSNWSIQTFQDGDYQFSADGTIVKYLGNETEIVIPDFLTTPDGQKVAVKKIGFQAFYLLSSKPTKITLPNYLETIAPEAFALNINLKEIVWNEALQSIGSSAFNGAKLSTIKLPKSVQLINQLAFSGISTLTEAQVYKGTSFFQKDKINISAINPSFGPKTIVSIYE